MDARIRAASRCADGDEGGVGGVGGLSSWSGRARSRARDTRSRRRAATYCLAFHLENSPLPTGRRSLLVDSGYWISVLEEPGGEGRRAGRRSGRRQRGGGQWGDGAVTADERKGNGWGMERGGGGVRRAEHGGEAAAGRAICRGGGERYTWILDAWTSDHRTWRRGSRRVEVRNVRIRYGYRGVEMTPWPPA